MADSEKFVALLGKRRWVLKGKGRRGEMVTALVLQMVKLRCGDSLRRERYGRISIDTAIEFWSVIGFDEENLAQRLFWIRNPIHFLLKMVLHLL